MNIAKTQNYKQTRVWVWARESWVGDSLRAYRKRRRESWALVRSRAGASMAACNRCRRELWAWARNEQANLPHVRQITESVVALRMAAADTAVEASDADAPIFLCSTAMRSGSTLLQRILVTDPRLLVWGEPFGEMDVVCRMAEMVSGSVSPWNLEWSDRLDPKSSSIATTWIADLYPPGTDFRLALRGFFDRWLGEPARQLGFLRWGLKEVRLGAAEAALLHWLYPQAKFVVITRNPYDCYRSLSDSQWQQVYTRRPDVQIDSAASFAGFWNRIALSWSELPEGFPIFHIKYEDLTAGKVDFRKLESWLGIEIKENVALSVPVGGTAKRSGISWYERLIISRVAAAGMQTFGYSEKSNPGKGASRNVR
jgi:hypothetical protein